MHIRRNVYSLSPTGPLITSLRQGIAEMKGRPPSDPTSWIYQANMHGTPESTAPPNQQAGRLWSKCQHAQFFFLSWHRMYLYFFERILRRAANNPDLALPYWNYSDPAQRALPIAFRQPADSSSNPLYVPQRNTGGVPVPVNGVPVRLNINRGDELPGSAVELSPAMRVRTFLPRTTPGPNFGGGRVPRPVHFAEPPLTGALENQPHNIVHSLVGGRQGGWMNNANMAARDPIFWLHHANIDRLWEQWLDQGDPRRNPVGNSVWMDTEFTFIDRDGAEVKMQGRDIVDTAGQLDYRYAGDPPGAIRRAARRAVAAEPRVSAAAVAGGTNEESPPRLLGSSEAEGMIELGTAPTTVGVQLEDAAEGEIAAAAAVGREAEEGIVALNLEGVQFEENPGVTYEVYLNLPEGEEPDYTSDYYVGNVGFFGMEGHGGHSTTLSFDVTDVVSALRERDEWTEGQASVSLVMRGLVPADGRETTPEEEEEGREALAEADEPPGSPRIERVTLTTG